MEMVMKLERMLKQFSYYKGEQILHTYCAVEKKKNIKAVRKAV